MPEARRHRRASSAGHAVRHRRRSGGRPAARRAQEGYQLTWMDAKVDDWVVTPRRGKAVEINALWYNALRLLDGWMQQFGGGDGDLDLDGARRARARVVQPAVLVRRGRLPVRRGRRRSTATIPACRPNQVFAISLDHPVLDRERWEPVMKVVRAAAADAGRPALAGAGPSGLQGEVLRRPALARRGLPPGHGLGLADRPVHRRLAEAASATTARGARHLLDGFEQHLSRSVRRVDQRDLRRRSAVHAARLRRPGLERRGSAALPGEDRCASARASAATSVGDRGVGRICLTADADRRLPICSPPNDRRSAGARLDGSIRGARSSPIAADGTDAGARQPRAHAHLPGARPGRTSGWRGCRDGCATRPRARADFPAVGDWVAVEPAGTAATPGSRPSCRGPAGSRAARPAIRPRSRSSPPTSTPCFSSAGSITTSIRAASSATWSSRGRAAPRRSSS